MYPKKPDDEKHVKQMLSFPPDIFARLLKYCQKEERTMSWCCSKALDEWLKSKGY